LILRSISICCLPFGFKAKPFRVSLTKVASTLCPCPCGKLRCFWSCPVTPVP
jgi:hypothetical protein